MNDTPRETPIRVSLTIPCRAEYVGVARLAILGVASRLNFSYDEVEDLRLAVGEACAGAVDTVDEADGECSPISIDCDVAPSELDIRVKYKRGSKGNVRPGDPENIGALLMEILVDSVEITDDSDGCTQISLRKSVQAV